jgi:hypothetical protein
MKNTDTVSLKGFWLEKLSPAKMSPAVILPAIAFTSVLLVVLTIAVFLTSHAACAQGISTSPTATQEPAAQPENHSNAQPHSQPENQTMQPVAVDQTFNGKIVKAGSHFVLLDAANSTTFELDDQQKAHGFLNKNVKVKGILDATTGTIRISAIDPA